MRNWQRQNQSAGQRVMLRNLGAMGMVMLSFSAQAMGGEQPDPCDVTPCASGCPLECHDVCIGETNPWCLEKCGGNPNHPCCLDPHGPCCVDPDDPCCLEPNTPCCLDPNSPCCIDPLCCMITCPPCHTCLLGYCISTCEAGDACCDGQCCQGVCCAGPCCPRPNHCIDGLCCGECDTAVCGGACCEGTCCGDLCCDPCEECGEVEGEPACVPKCNECQKCTQRGPEEPCESSPPCEADPEKDCDPCAAGGQDAAGVCEDGECVAQECDFTLEIPVVLCDAGDSVDVPVAVSCDPSCDLTVIFSDPDAENGIGITGSAGCEESDTLTVAAEPGVEKGTIQVIVDGRVDGRLCGWTLLTVKVGPDLRIVSLTPPTTVRLGEDVDIEYEILASPPEVDFDEVNLEIRNASGVLVYEASLDKSPGIHTVTWNVRWNVDPHAGAYANPRNGPYTIKIIGLDTECPDKEDTRPISTQLVIEADVTDRPEGLAVPNVAGLEDMLDALKIVLRLGVDETQFTGPGSITVTGTTREAKHLKLEDPGLNTLSDGRYSVLFRDLRDEIGNFTDADANPANGIQPVEFSLEIW